tara:strand:- start:517 stop:795 length:279 start_codon:yes stop_codon:yes gene_type:complete
MTESLKISDLVEGKLYQLKRVENRFVHKTNDGVLVFTRDHSRSGVKHGFYKDISGQVVFFYENHGNFISVATLQDCEIVHMNKKNVKYLEEI